jgi:hypothetical protein
MGTTTIADCDQDGERVDLADAAAAALAAAFLLQRATARNLHCSLSETAPDAMFADQATTP